MKHSSSRAAKHALNRPRVLTRIPPRWRGAGVALAVVASTIIVALQGGGSPAAARSAETLFRAAGVPTAQVASTTRPTELGMRFNVTVPGTITGVSDFSTPTSRGVHTGSLWAGPNSRLATVKFPAASGAGWQSASFAHGVHVVPGRTYTVSYYAPHGHYAVRKHGFRARVTNGHIHAAKAAGVYRIGKGGGFPRHRAGQANYLVDVTFVPDPIAGGNGATLPLPLPTVSLPSLPLPVPTGSSAPTNAPTTTAPTSSSAPTTAAPTTSSPKPSSSAPATTPPATSTSAWPGENNTGVPADTSLKAYSGSCTISSAQTITGVDMTKCDSVLIRAANVIITDSLLPVVDATNGGSDSVTLTDDTVKGGNWSEGAVWGYNITATRVNLSGGAYSLHCAGNCTVTDSWLHDQYNPDGQAYHNNAFLSNGGSNMVIRHNTLACTAILNSTNGGCSGDLSLFGDFDPISNVTVDDNLFVANNSSISYCLYGGYDPGKKYGSNPTDVKVTNNVFQRGANKKCGVYGPVTSFKSASRDTWTNNTWDDGTVLKP